MAAGQLRAYTEGSIKEMMSKAKKLRSDNRQEELITSLIGLTAIFVATAIWWSLAPQWLTSSWQTF
jgi:cytoskeletal protein RodZ